MTSRQTQNCHAQANPRRVPCDADIGRIPSASSLRLRGDSRELNSSSLRVRWPPCQVMLGKGPRLYLYRSIFHGFPLKVISQTSAPSTHRRCFGKTADEPSRPARLPPRRLPGACRRRLFRFPSLPFPHGVSGPRRTHCPSCWSNPPLSRGREVCL